MGRILLIDDAQLTRTLLRNILETAGYTVCGEAVDGREGFEKFKELRPELVFCDIMMNEVNGMQCLRSILQEDPAAKVVVCTSASDELHVMEAREAGAVDFLAKPIRAADVKRVTNALIGPPQVLSYRQRMEQKAAAAGVDGKPFLDFLEAFQQINGFSFDDPRVSDKFMRENGAGAIVGIRALLSPKMASAQADKLADIFRELIL